MFINDSNKVILILITLCLTCTIGYADVNMLSQKVNKAPIIDGKADSLWDDVPSININDVTYNKNISMKSINDGVFIYFIVSFDDKEKNIEHRALHWDKTKQLYMNGPEREDSFIIKWNMSAYKSNLTLKEDAPYKADIWFWKANRTDHAGYADDKLHKYTSIKQKNSKILLSKNGSIFYLTRNPDSGIPAYSSNLYYEYTKDTIPKYVFKQPSGSRADIKAKGDWKNKKWTIEFARKLNTNNADDIQLVAGKSYYFATSITEIAGREPEPDSENPMYGAGEVGELIYISIQK